MASKTILVVDDEQGFIEPLRDALEFEGYRVLSATTVEDALRVINSEAVDLVTVDIMMPPGSGLESQVSSQEAGLFLCKKLRQTRPNLDVFCISVVSDERIVGEIKDLNIRFLRKGETPLRTVLAMIQSCITGVAYDSDDPRRRRDDRGR